MNCIYCHTHNPQVWIEYIDNQIACGKCYNERLEFHRKERIRREEEAKQRQIEKDAVQQKRRKKNA